MGSVANHKNRILGFEGAEGSKEGDVVRCGYDKGLGYYFVGEVGFCVVVVVFGEVPKDLWVKGGMVADVGINEGTCPLGIVFVVLVEVLT